MALDPTARAIVDAMSAAFPDLGGTVTDAVQARAIVEATPRPPVPDVALRSVEDRHLSVAGVPPIPARFYRPDAAGALPAIVFFHGGGFVLSSVAGHDAFARKLAVGTGALVVSVEYRLAPEHQFPAALDDATAATRWVAEHAADLGVDAKRIAVAGDSAGGNLAAVACLRARDHGGPKLAAQLLIYPVLDARQDTDSYRENADGFFLTAAHMRWFWEQYLDGADPDDPDVSPVRADDLSGLPPAVVVVGEHDALSGEGRDYAALLAAAGNHAELLDYPGMFHGFFGLTAALPTAQRANDEAFAAVKRLLAGESAVGQEVSP